MSIFDSAPIKAEGTTIAHNLSSSGDSYTYKAAGRYTDAMTPYGKTQMQLDKLEYILQRTVPNYDELSEHFNAIKDIERSNNDIR